MKKLIILSLLIFNSCSKEQLKHSQNNNINFSNNLNFNEFKLKVEEYVKSNSYPILDE